MAIAVLCASVVFQLLAVVAALRLIKATNRSVAWALIASALLLMTVRRLVPLYSLLTTAHGQVDLGNEVVGLVLSVFMFVGVTRIGPLFEERRAAEETLARTAREWQATFDASNDAIWMLDHEQRVVRSNKQADQLWQRPGAGAIGQHCWKAVHGTNAPISDCPVRRSRLSGHRETLALELGGRWYEITGDPIVDQAAQYAGAVHVVRDITDLKRAEALAALSSQRMRALLHLNQMTDAALQQITDFALEEAVRLTQSTIGYLAFVSDDESILTMHSWSKAAMAECAIIDKPIVYPIASTGLWGEAVRQRKPVITNDYVSRSPLKKGCPQGHVTVKRHMNAPIFDGSRIVIVAGVGNKEGEYDQSDVEQLTLIMEGAWRLLERRRADAALRESEENLRRLNASLEQRVCERTIELAASTKELEAFSYSVSHDLRAPLRAIDGFGLALLEDCDDKLDTDGKDSLRRIRAATQRMGSLIDDMLRLSRITRAELFVEKVDVTEIAWSVIDELRKSNPERLVKVEIAKGLEDTADPKLIRIALENLLGNAWKFTGKQSEAVIELGSTAECGKKTYFIRDNGAGFDMAYADKLFTPFQRLHSTDEYPGTGIGLGTVQRIMHRHGGKAWAEGQVGKGATFYFSFQM
jgi:two-component system, OmpR family, phosphate regulon sensor histidine kinase PhoR